MSAKKVFGTAIFVITVMLLLSLGVFFNPSDPIRAFEHQFTVYDADINLEEEELYLPYLGIFLIQRRL